MSSGILAAIIFVSFFGLLFLGFPAAFGLYAVSTMGFLLYLGPRGFYALVPNNFSTVTTDIYIALPLFIFMATILQGSGVGEAMYDAMYKWFGGLSGGLALGTVVLSTLIAAITGLAATATLLTGLIAFPEMIKRGYNKHLAIGVIVAGGTLGPIIPPSMPAIVLGGLTGVSIGKLFMAGVIPGLMLAAVFSGYIGVRSALNPAFAPALPKPERVNMKEKLVSLKGLVLPILLIILVLGGIWNGIFTPTEAGGVGAVGAIVCTLINRKLNKKTLVESVTSSGKMTAMLVWLLIGGVLFSALLNMTKVTDFLSQAIVGLPLPRYGILIMMLLVVFIEGMFMESTPIIFSNIPIMWPVALKLGFDPVWFIFIFIFTLVIGFITPPFGVCLFYMKGMNYKDVSMGDIYKASITFTSAMIVVLAICIVFPQTVLFVPNMMIR